MKRFSSKLFHHDQGLKQQSPSAPLPRPKQKRSLRTSKSENVLSQLPHSHSNSTSRSLLKIKKKLSITFHAKDSAASPSSSPPLQHHPHPPASELPPLTSEDEYDLRNSISSASTICSDASLRRSSSQSNESHASLDGPYMKHDDMNQFYHFRKYLIHR